MPARRNSPMAPYFVQMREFERRLMIGALATAEGDVAGAAQMLGVTQHYVRARAKLLGGVLGGEPKHEPPGRAINAWNSTNGIGTRSRAEKHQPNGDVFSESTEKGQLIDDDEAPITPNVEISDEVAAALLSED